MGIKPLMVADAMADFSPERHDSALRYAAERCAVVTATRALMEQLDGGVHVGAHTGADGSRA